MSLCKPAYAISRTHLITRALLSGPGCDLIGPLSTVRALSDLYKTCVSCRIVTFRKQPAATFSMCDPRHLPQARGKGYRGDTEGVEPVFGLEAGSDTAAWANRPQNYARMQARHATS